MAKIETYTVKAVPHVDDLVLISDSEATNATKNVKIGTMITKPAGSDKQVQFNNAGVMGATAEFTWDGVKRDFLMAGAVKGGTISSDDWGYNFFYGPTTGFPVGATVTDLGWNIFLGENNQVQGANQNVNNAFMTGYNNRIKDAGSHVYSAFIFGTENEINGGGIAPTIFGGSNLCSGSYSLATGVWTHATAGGITGGKGANATDKRIIASGVQAINISLNTIAQTAGHGALAANCAILGGQDHNIPSDSPRSAILGGNAIKIAATTPDTVYVPHLRIGQGTGATIVQNDSEDQLAVVDASTGQIKWRSAPTVLIASEGYLSVTNTNITQVHTVSTKTSVVDALTVAFRVYLDTSGSAVAGFGAATEYIVRDGAGGFETLGRIGMSLSDATSSPGGNFIIEQNQAGIGGMFQTLSLTPTGVLTIGSSGTTFTPEIKALSSSGSTSLKLTPESGGTINMANLPTSSAGLSTGDIWNNSGVLNIV